MRDAEFPKRYLLTVFPFTRDVFFYVPSATVDLSVFGDPAAVIHSLRSAHRSIRFRSVTEQRKATIEGPFAGVRALRQDLIIRAGQLEETETAAGTSNPREKSPALQSPRTPNDSPGRKDSRETAGSFYNNKNEQEGAKASSKTPAEQAGASEKRSGLDRIPAAQIGLTDPGKLSAERRPDRDDTSIWVDSYTLRYIEKFDRQKLDGCLRGFEVKREGADLTRITWTERKTSAAARKSLEDLLQFWQPMLRVHQIDCDRKQKQKLVQICDDLKTLFRNILYIPEDSCVKVVGTSVSSHLFCEWVEERLKDALRSKNH